MTWPIRQRDFGIQFHAQNNVCNDPKYCKFTFIPENFILANIREYDHSQVQHSCEVFAYIEFTLENIIHRE